jgi:16S rRNA (cytosine967-C5)-methyltransferase
MTPAARVQSAIELLDLIIIAARENGAAADTIIANWFRERRYAGSGDRRAVRELVYRAIRAFGEPPVSGRAAVLGLGDMEEHFDGSNHAPAPVAERETKSKATAIPGWLARLIPIEEQTALLGRASFDLRVNALMGDRSVVAPLLPGAEPIAGTSFGLRLPENIALDSIPALRGLVEVQDGGSQIIAAACSAKPGDLIVDLCAGAGGKTLALAAAMAGEGRLIALDTDRGRLSRLPQRAGRALAENIETRLLNPGEELASVDDLMGEADCVLVDAPCSGTGTWRRNPELRWRLTPKRLAQTVETQAHVLNVAGRLVKPGGRLVYAVCSLIDQEGRDQIDAFLARHNGWTVAETASDAGRIHGKGRILTPKHDGTDGFFFATLARSANG